MATKLTMDYSFHILTTVVFRHTYFANNRYTGFTVEPDAETQHHFKRLSLLFKSQANGFTLLYETGPGLERTREEVLKEGLTFGFVIMNSDKDFLNYTDGLPEDIAQTILYLRNSTQGNHTDPEGLLHENTVFSVNDILHNQPPDKDNPNNRSFFVKPFAWMQITLHALLEQTLAVNFKGKETVWRYILSSEHLQELSEPAIIHKDTKEAFTGPVPVALPDGNTRMSFESKQKIPLCNKPEKNYQLVENYDAGSGKYKVVLGILPNPDIRLITLINRDNDKKRNIFSEIFI